MAGSFLAAGRSKIGCAAMPFRELGALLTIAQDSMLKRGRASLGDKTVIDAIAAVATAIEGKDDAAAVAVAAREAAESVLVKFRDCSCRIGRARMWGDKSKGLDDPGMLAMAKLTTIIAEQAPSQLHPATRQPF
jgi:hypothetical protein